MERINYSGDLIPSYSVLDDLQQHHILHIPFENLFVMSKIPIELNFEWLSQKLIKKKRGGFCFEQNGLFYKVLQEIGFRVKMIEASVYIERKSAFGGMRNHMALIVNLSEDYLVDVGFGRSSRHPLPLSGKQSNCVDGTFRVARKNGQYEVQYLDKGWHTQYKFNTEALSLEDFQPNCDWIQSSPDSLFTQGRLITQATLDGRITLEEGFIQIRDSRGEERIKIEKYEFERYFDKYFGKYYE